MVKPENKVHHTVFTGLPNILYRAQFNIRLEINDVFDVKLKHGVVI